MLVENIISFTGAGEKLKAGEVSESLFWLLVELSSLRSEKTIRALNDFLVLGYTRKEVCEKYHLSGGNFSVALRRIMHVDGIARLVAAYYNSKETE
ncbi:major pilu subunit operon regulatory protein PapB [Escherichia coli]|uniref:PapB/FocB family fimbrial expression transcriptional regulator n=1 Tax=Escherichia coli TaxID=562 RepID=UPI0019190DCF|nr:PapB/FocB family fimbrial expression transcriptional regulator [Escherichia coli]ECP5780207.1 transcriptional regulator [Salmonella enterica]CAD5644428.1 major pilu subunit operon regulatory protein PapB [Escherichia coli]CAD5645266.1 major pilu subunit operon regulatory protein PapB [Escherichia coli]HAX5242329.1 transcriptional regulator [Escherichia coli]